MVFYFFIFFTDVTNSYYIDKETQGHTDLEIYRTGRVSQTKTDCNTCIKFDSFLLFCDKLFCCELQHKSLLNASFYDAGFLNVSTLTTHAFSILS